MVIRSRDRSTRAYAAAVTAAFVWKCLLILTEVRLYSIIIISKEILCISIRPRR